MKLGSLKPNPNNPRLIKDERFAKLVQSIKEFPAMMSIRPMIIDENNIMLGGNMRLKAIRELGMKEIPEDWVKKASELTEDEKKRFVITDNNSFGEYDWDIIANEWGDLPIEDWGVDLHIAKDDADSFSDEGVGIKNQYGVIVICGGEREQETVFKDLSGKGFNCKVVVT